MVVMEGFVAYRNLVQANQTGLYTITSFEDTYIAILFGISWPCSDILSVLY